ncbi:flagellar hook-length control protein FliK [Tardiphaga sp.]|uniref:flagellar hook-length control protein FliK n=1 Tax=Tardiphaga sp. TaxID=1926292 RepID=UPI00261FE96B|nr:flagellar hook-length control protein FliK [Tardiphaga sp.]
MSLQNARAKSAQDNTSASDSFGSLVDSNTPPPATVDTNLNRQPADTARRDDRTAQSSDRADAAAARDARNDDARTASANRADAAKDARSETADRTLTRSDARPDAKSKSDTKSDAKSDDKSDATAGNKTDKDSSIKETKTEGATATDATTPEQAVPVTAVAVVIPAVVAPTDATATPNTTADAGAAQPGAIAAAVLKAQAAAAKTATTTGTGTGTEATPEAATPGSTDPDFAALIATATPAGPKTAAKTGGKTAETATAAPTGAAAATPTTLAGQTPVDSKAAAETKPGEVTAEGAKPDATATDATAKPTPHAAHEHQAPDAAPAPLAAADITPTNTTQQQPLLQTTASAAVTAQQLTANVATDAAVPLNGLAVEIAQSAQSGKSRFDIRLDPAELGRIDVRLDVDRHGNVTSHLTVEKPETLAMLRQDAPQLQRALEQAGLKSDGNGLQFSLRDQSSSGQQNNGDNSGRQSQRLIIREDDALPAVTAGRNYGRMLGSSRGIDISI